MHCIHCGFPITSQMTYCANCKQTIYPAPPPPPKPPIPVPPSVQLPLNSAQAGFFGAIGAWIALHLLAGTAVAGTTCAVPTCGCLAIFGLLAILALASIGHIGH